MLKTTILGDSYMRQAWKMEAIGVTARQSSLRSGWQGNWSFLERQKKTATANLTKLPPLTGLHLFSERVVFGCQDIENNGKPRLQTMSTSHLAGGSQPDNVIINTVNMSLEKTRNISRPLL